MAQTQLNLGLPERVKPDRNSFDIRPKKLERWINDLPRANLGETARLVFKALKDTNQLAFSCSDRFQFLEAMREPVAYITGTMKKYYVGVNFPLAEKNYKVAVAVREIYSAMATGYKIAIDDQLKGAALFRDGKLQRKLFHRALTMLGNMLLASYRAYEPLPPNTWLSIHLLYGYAENKKLHTHDVHDEYRKFAKTSTLQDQYLRLLLTHLASPYRLRQGEVGKIYHTLERWTKFVELKPKTGEQDGGIFAVNLASNEPPRSLVITSQGCSNELCRLIDTEQLAVNIRNEIQNSTDMSTTTLPGIDMQREELSHDLLRRLLIAWGIIPKRVFPRNDKQEEVQITLGLSSSHKVISDGDDQDHYFSQSQSKDRFIHTAKFDAGTVKNVNDKQPDVWARIYPGAAPEKLQAEIEPPAVDETKLNQDIAQRYKHIETWSIRNESAGGYCLLTEQHPASNLQVGELIGIQRAGEGDGWKWGIAVVRWMKHDKREGLSLGVEMLNPVAAAIGIRSAFSEDQNDYRRTLMLPEITAIRQPKTLITPPVPYRVGNQLVMRCLGKDIPILLTKLLQNTGFFAQFEFDIVNSHEQPGTPKKSQATKTDDFDNVWSLI
ncbi:MAG: hypothetical protein OEZ39_04270 [Gammaproteobacteria bacterium]|nr:hypothetical protein [Gammaproteobacteria bacterium]MDH5651074.1 hypothetical protein [Gammaproteobacteria bacterium]